MKDQMYYLIIDPKCIHSVAIVEGMKAIGVEITSLNYEEAIEDYPLTSCVPALIDGEGETKALGSEHCIAGLLVGHEMHHASNLVLAVGYTVAAKNVNLSSRSRDLGTQRALELYKQIDLEVMNKYSELVNSDLN